MHAAVSSHLDDHVRHPLRRTAAGLWTRARFGASTAPRNHGRRWSARVAAPDVVHNARRLRGAATADETRPPGAKCRSEEHTSELQSHLNLVCRLLLQKKKT